MVAARAWHVKRNPRLLCRGCARRVYSDSTASWLAFTRQGICCGCGTVTTEDGHELAPFEDHEGVDGRHLLCAGHSAWPDEHEEDM